MSVRAADVQAALRERFSAPEFAIFFEVPNATGGAAARRADAIAMSLWPSRGLDLHGFEIKVDRRDWLRELKDPTKAEEHARFTDHWWIAATPDVVKGEELPRGWGLMVLRGSVLRVEREAPKREGVVPTRPFLAALLRAAAAASPAEEAVRAAVEHALVEERRTVKRQAETLRSHAELELERLKSSLRDFESASGVHVSAYDGKQMGEAVRFVLEGRLRFKRQRIAAFADEAKKIVAACEAALAVDLGEEGAPTP